MTNAHDDTIEIEPRPTEAIARRAAVLVALLRRAALEAPAEDGEVDGFARDTDRFDLYSWVRREAAGSLSNAEQALLATPAGELDEESADDCLLAAVPARALAWSVGAIDALSPSDPSEAHSYMLIDWAPEPWDDVSRWARTLSLLPEQAMAEERERWELWHWRATLTPDDLEPGEALSTVVADVARDVDASGLVAVARGDFAIDGQPFSTLQADQREAIGVLAEGYLHALNWVCGFGGAWDDVPLYPD